MCNILQRRLGSPCVSMPEKGSEVFVSELIMAHLVKHQCVCVCVCKGENKRSVTPVATKFTATLVGRDRIVTASYM